MCAGDQDALGTRDGMAAPDGVTGAVHLLLIEIGNFVALRRLLGVGRADRLTVDVAERLAAICPQAAVTTTGRNLVELSIGGNADGLDALVDTVRSGFAQAINIDGEHHHLHLLVGAATSLATEADEVRLTELAEQMLGEAREEQSVSTAKPVAAPSDDVMIGRELQVAIMRDELFLQYQPKLHLRRQEVTSVEALIRWQHPQRGLVMPNEFIAAAERTGDIAAMTLWTLRQVIADQRALQRNGYDLPVFVNMAGVLLSDAAFVNEVVSLIEGSGARLGVEITETSVIGDPQGAIEHLKRLAAIGVIVTIDDYGAGLSSLAYLKQLPASELKIDKLFVTQLSSSHRDPLIVRSTIDLAHALDMEVVAEGVETPASLALLSVMGCDMVQGFLISRPLTLEALLHYLRDERHLPVIHAPRFGFGPSAAFRSVG